MTKLTQNTQILPKMGFEFAALYGELYRIYQQVEDENDKSGGDQMSARLETAADRMFHGCMVIALAALPFLEKVVIAEQERGEAGSFVYDCLELISAKDWAKSNALPAYLFREIADEMWYEAAENCVVDVGALNALIDVWASGFVTSWTEATTEGDGLLTGADLMDKYGMHSEHPVKQRSDWKREVADNDTHLGYWDWVCAQLEGDHNIDTSAGPTYPAAQCNKRLATHVGKTDASMVTLTQIEPGTFHAEYNGTTVSGAPTAIAQQYGAWVFRSLCCDGVVELA